MAEEEERVEYVTRMFSKALEEFTTWTQVLNYFANQPAVVRNKTYEKIQLDISGLSTNIAATTARVAELEARLQELKDAAGD